MKKEIELEIQKRKDIYKSSPDDMISAYNRELETEKEYNGRQLLELLQNADDENSDEVYIELNTKNSQLIIANRGTHCKSFSLDGIKSLMISNLSSKVTKKYIGNKGLGFRSIINWSNKVIINSNNLDIIFSKEIVNDIFDELFTKDDENKFIEKRNLPQGTKPIPFLAMPKVVENIQNKWITKITIEYKDSFLDDIKEQINDLKNEILLFLNHLVKLTLNIDGEIREVIKKQDNEFIYINNEKWTIYEDEAKLPKRLWEKKNEEEFYNLKLALKEDYDIQNNLLFAYFPTHISMDFPFIIHGTFDLNSSRNSINKSDKNRYILEKLVLLITKTAKELTQNEVSYKALEFLLYKDEHPTLETLGFYEQLDNAIEELEIFPCIDNTYRKREDVVYISNEFSNFITKVNAVDLFSNLLISTEQSVIDVSIYELNNSISTSTEKLNLLSQKISNIEDRVNLIYIFYHTFKRENKLLFLIDEKKEFIPIEDKVYTPNLGVHIEIPSYVDIRFIHNELYKKLLQKFNATPQQLVEKLKEMTNIESYNAKSILNKIVVATNKELKKDNIDKIRIIKEMVLSLYSNYKSLDSKIFIDAKVQLIAKNKSIVKANDLYLSKTYPSGELTEELFGEIFKDNQFLIDINFWEFKYENKNDIESFFLWLGVNQYTKYSISNINKQWEYKKNIFKNTNYTKIYDEEIIQIDNIELILHYISKEKLLTWILLDRKLFSEILDKKIYKYFYRTYHYLTDTISYIRFQLSKAFKDYFITTDEKFSKIINDNPINFNYYLLKKYALSQRDIESLILKLGAVEEFKELSKDKVIDILKKLSFTSLNGEYTQRVYQLAYKNFYEQYFYIHLGEINLFAKKDGISSYFNQNKVYYSGNTKIPKQIIRRKAIFNFPKGYGSKKVTDFFAINDLSKLELKLISKIPISHLTDKFNKLFKRLIPFILAYRIKDIEKDKTAYSEFNKLKKIYLILCEEVRYDFETQEYELEYSDYLKDGNEYLIHVNRDSTIDELRNDFDFIDTFSDILGLVFGLEETKIFRDIIKNNINYIERMIINNLGIEALHRAKSIMGIDNEEELFWKIVYKSLNREYIDKSNNLLDLIKNDLELKIDITTINYQNLNAKNSLKVIKELFIELGLEVENYNNHEPYYQLNFSKYHNYNLLNCFHDNQKRFEQHLYKYCKKNSKEKDFLFLLDKYTHNSEFVKDNVLNIDYQNIVQQFIKENFEFNIDSPIDEVIDYQSIYEKNKLEIDFEKIKGQREYDSLLYFDKLDEIKKYIKSLKKEEQPKSNNSPKKPPKPIIENPKIEKPFLPKRNGGKGGKGGTYNPNRDRAKEDKGKNAEKNVVQTLKKEFGENNVDWVNDDTIGYDIKYKNKQDIWKYVEVKVYSNSKFFLSKNEKRFVEKNKENYEIFLVAEEEIYRLTNIDFYDRDKFILEANSYEVYYNIKKR